MAAVIFSEIIETNMVTVVALDDAPMSFLVRVNGNIRPLRDMLHLLSLESLRIERGPLTA